MAALVLVARHADSPFLDLGLFGNRLFAAATGHYGIVAALLIRDDDARDIMRPRRP
ncbi:hypothetical protein [Gluconacetobacter sacchari]|uniref:Uncharacterized protein n=1 Tax=Gluconacetobacter sacchari TaxID=92759 RepID=A0A7W4IAJ8_9PROT|nr:hypothetical protein [Gluconacetobacter sacchari]MBB2159303.1 hypothetical protein [Gluconacetobacter sacchari]